MNKSAKEDMPAGQVSHASATEAIPDSNRPGSLIETDPKTAATAPGTRRGFLLYFLRLGIFGFGGPIALAGYMQRDLVESRRWITQEDYSEGLAFAQMAPGPLAAQLAMYLGWVRYGRLGATLVACTFILPSFIMVLALSMLYVHYGGLAWMQGVFYGVNAAVIAIIARSAYKLARTMLRQDRLLWGLFGASAAVTLWTQTELVWVLVLCGVIALLVKAPPRIGRTSAAAFLPPWLVTGLLGSATVGTLWKIFGFFAVSGAVVFGSGLAIVPFLHGGVVDHYHWLTERQFLDAVAVAMITPGPVVITVAFIGYLVAGLAGAILAALGVFLPVYLFVIIVAPYFRRFSGSARVRAFIAGVTAAVTGALAGAVLILGRRALVDMPALVIALGTLGILLGTKKVPEPLLIFAAGLAGFVLKSLS